MRRPATGVLAAGGTLTEAKELLGHAYTAATMPAKRLRQVILEGLPGTSMPAWQHVLSADEVDALAAFVQRALFRGDTALAGAAR